MINLIGSVLEEITARERDRKQKQAEFNFLMQQKKQERKLAQEQEADAWKKTLYEETLKSVLRRREKEHEAGIKGTDPLALAKVESERALQSLRAGQKGKEESLAEKYRAETENIGRGKALNDELTRARIELEKAKTMKQRGDIAKAEMEFKNKLQEFQKAEARGGLTVEQMTKLRKDLADERTKIISWLNEYKFKTDDADDAEMKKRLERKLYQLDADIAQLERKIGYQNYLPETARPRGNYEQPIGPMPSGAAQNNNDPDDLRRYLNQ
jgi:hypothetical protein